MRLSFIGGGKIASALICGQLEKGAHPSDIAVSDINPAATDALAKKGVYVTSDNADAASRGDIVVIAVKPQHIDSVLPEIAQATAGKIVLSVAAGVTASRIGALLSSARKVVRAMPNTPMLIGMGAVAVDLSGLDAGDAAAVRGVFSPCGEVFDLPEDMMDTVTALSGSGPAYFYRMAGVLAAWAAGEGMPYDVALKMVVKTMEGSAGMIKKGDKSVEELIRDVSSPGGTTLAALGAMDKRGLDEALRAAADAAKKRARELGGK